MAQDFGYRANDVLGIAVGYDWLRDQWTDDQRVSLGAHLMDSCHAAIDVIRTERLSPYNVYLYNRPRQSLMACAVALYGDLPQATPVTAFAADLWTRRVLPVWRQVMGRNGGWHEGKEYLGIGIGQVVWQLPAIWRSATGEDLLASEPGLRGFLDFLLYRTRPDGTHFRWGGGGFFDGSGVRVARLSTRGILRRDYLRALRRQQAEVHATYFGNMLCVVVILEQWLETHDVDVL
jgi:hypothetical protein